MSAGLVLPAYINGQQTWMAEADPEIVKLLQEGDPTIGWEGDPRLYIRRNNYTGGWTVWRLCEDGQERAICSSKASHNLDKSLLIRLRDHDSRKVDVFQKVDKQNTAAKKAQDTAQEEFVHEMLEKVYWAAAKDLGNNA